MTVADVTKSKEVLAFINQKFNLSQTGLIRENIWAKKTAPELDDGEYPEAVFFKTINLLPTNVQTDAVNLNAWGMKQKNSGIIFFQFADVKTKDNNCDINFNMDMDFSSVISKVNASCCINIHTEQDMLHVCSTATFRCEF